MFLTSRDSWTVCVKKQTKLTKRPELISKYLGIYLDCKFYNHVLY